jgi:hypothetical protein
MLKLTYNPELCERLRERLPIVAPDILAAILRGQLSKLGHTILTVGDRIRIIDRRGRSTDYRPGKILAKLIDDAARIEKLSHILLGDRYQFEIVTGSAIGELYEAEEDYHHDRSARPGCYSCMAGMDSNVFRLYSRNPDQIGLLVARDFAGEYHGRAIIYLKDGEPRYHSRRFYMEEDTRAAALQWLKDEGISQINHCHWRLDRTDFDQYPYLDDFEGIDDDGLSDAPTRACKNTNGYADDARTCEDCGDGVGDDDSTYIGDRCICETCYRDNYTTIEHGNHTYIFNDNDIQPARDYVADDYTIAARDDCYREVSRTDSSYGSTVWIVLDNGDQGTEDELTEDLTCIDDDGTYWTSEASELGSVYITDGYHVGRIEDAIETY